MQVVKRIVCAGVEMASGKGGGVVTLTLATLFGQTFQFIGAIVLTRLYTPSEFGFFAVFLAINIVLLPIVTFRYEWAIPIVAGDDEAHDVFGLSITLALAAGLALGCLACMLMAVFMDATISSGLMPLALIVISVNASMQFWFVRRNDLRMLSRIRFTFLAAPVLGQIVLGLVLGGLDGLVIGYIFGHALNTLLSFSYCREVVRESLKRWSYARLAAVARTHRRFAIFSGPAGVVHTINMQLPVMVMPTVFGMGMAGTYALAQRVVMQPIYLISYSIQMAFWGTAARAIREDPETVRPHFLKASAGVAMLLIPAFAVAPFAPWMFALIFGEAWRNSGVYAGILLIPAITQIVSHGTSCLHMFGHNKWQMYISVGQLLACSLVLTLAWSFALDPVTSIFGLAVSAILAHLILWGSNAFVLQRGRKPACIEADRTLQ